MIHDKGCGVVAGSQQTAVVVVIPCVIVCKQWCLDGKRPLQQAYAGEDGNAQ